MTEFVENYLSPQRVLWTRMNTWQQNFSFAIFWFLQLQKNGNWNGFCTSGNWKKQQV